MTTPTEQEWTAEMVVSMMQGSQMNTPYSDIANAHNAALDAAVLETASRIGEILIEREQQLAAERTTSPEATKSAEWTVETTTGSNPMKRIMCGEQKIIGWTMRPYSESFQMLADKHNAEREKAKQTIEGVIEMYEKVVAAEREKHESCVAWEDHNETLEEHTATQDKLAAAREALKELKDDWRVYSFPAAKEILDAALAKLGENK